MDELVIMALVAAGLYVVIDTILLCKNVYQQRKEKRKNKEGNNERNSDIGK